MSLLTWSVAQLGLRPPYPFCDMIMMETCERLAGAWVRGGGAPGRCVGRGGGVSVWQEGGWYEGRACAREGIVQAPGVCVHVCVCACVRVCVHVLLVGMVSFLCAF